MKHILLLGTLLISTIFLSAQSKDEKAVLQVLKELETAQKQKDLIAFDRIYADDLVFINHLGQLMNKKERLEALRSAAPMEMFSFGNEKLRISGNIAIVNLEATMKPQAQKEQVHTVTIMVRKNKGIWLVCNIQATVKMENKN